MYAITISVQANSIEPGISYLAPKLASPVLTLKEQSQIAIDQKGTYVRTGHIYKDIWRFIVYYWTLLGAIYLIYKWNIIIYKWLPKTPYSNNSSAEFTNLILAATLFVVIQMIFLGYIASQTPENDYWSKLNTPFSSLWTFGHAFPYFISEANALVEATGTYGSDNITENITIVSNEKEPVFTDNSKAGIVIH